MFACGDDFLYLGVHTTLKPWNETFDVFFNTEWVLSRSFLASAPSRVFERVDIWSLRFVSSRAMLQVEVYVIPKNLGQLCRRY